MRKTIDSIDNPNSHVLTQREHLNKARGSSQQHSLLVGLNDRRKVDRFSCNLYPSCKRKNQNDSYDERCTLGKVVKTERIRRSRQMENTRRH